MSSKEEKKAINNMKIFARVHQDMSVVTAKEIDVVLELVEKLKKENKELKSDNLEKARILEMFDDRKYRKKYLEERRKEEPNLLYPDGDEIYKRYYEQKKQIDLMIKYIDNSNYVDSEECQFQYDFKIKKCIEKGDCKECIKQYFESKSKEE